MQGKRLNVKDVFPGWVILVTSAESKQTKLEERSKKLSILLVDDEQDIYRVYSDLLRKYGFSVTSYSSANDVLQFFRKSDYDLAILDVRMPLLNGYELYEKLRAIDSEIQVIFMTAYYFTDTKFQENHRELTKSNFMLKPLDIDRLMETITDIMHSKSSAS